MKLNLKINKHKYVIGIGIEKQEVIDISLHFASLGGTIVLST